ncbi:ATP synthase subunit I [Phormidium sp. CCY1219]|uniref:ATP synthase subunit I n=1 Tax=Phormidium sp. CCY1219 TaxID=2886104 RepID=UPI002D1E5E57|nr:ATP synthase subunit I [Phormidium sp. CCY1219]
MNLSDPSPETNPERQEPSEEQERVESETAKENVDRSMEEYLQLKNQLLAYTFVMSAIAFVSAWFYYSLNVALNYAIGACVGVVYLRMLARDVERLGREKSSLSKSRLALFAGLIIVATQWNQLQVLPIFLGFLTYKAALFVYVLQTTLLPDAE